MKFKKVYIFIIFVLSILLFGCGNSKIINTTEKGPTKTITDSIGREVIVPDIPKRVACLYTNTGHFITMLDHGDTIVAVSNGLKRDKLLHEIVPSIANATLVKVSGDINMEALLNEKVDLIFLPKDMYESKEQIKQLEKYNIPYVVTEFTSIEEQKQNVLMLGEIFNNTEEALSYISFYNDIIQTVSNKTAEIPMENRKRIYHSLNEATNTVAKNTLPAEWMAIAGGIDVSIEGKLEQNGDKYYTSLEEILYLNPEIIFCNEDGVDEYIKEKEAWQEIDAVKNDKVYLLPNGISRWGHSTSIETPLAIGWTAKTLYPTVFEDFDIKQATLTFYKDFFEYDLSEEELNQLMSGKDMRLSKELK